MFFRTNFLFLPSGIAGTGEAGRSHSPKKTAHFVPTDAEIPNPSVERGRPGLREMVYRDLRSATGSGLTIVPERHEQTISLVPFDAAVVLAGSTG